MWEEEKEEEEEDSDLSSVANSSVANEWEKGADEDV